MRILGISGSPRKEGFTNLLLEESLDGARALGAETDKIILNDLSIKPCQGCLRCADTRVCVQPDDMTIVYEKISAANALIVASPIYFGTISAQLKVMIDRFNSVWVDAGREGKKMPLARNKPGAFICVAGEDRIEYFQNAKQIVRIFFTTLGVNYSKELFVGGIDRLTENSAIRKEALLKSYDLGQSIAKSS